MQRALHAQQLVKGKKRKQDHFLIKVGLSLSTQLGKSLKTKINLAAAMEISEKQLRYSSYMKYVSIPVQPITHTFYILIFPRKLYYFQNGFSVYV